VSRFCLPSLGSRQIPPFPPSCTHNILHPRSLMNLLRPPPFLPPSLLLIACLPGSPPPHTHTHTLPPPPSS
jgi:hypothetical protein